jgi:hypothetical protein
LFVTYSCYINIIKIPIVGFNLSLRWLTNPHCNTGGDCMAC